MKNTAILLLFSVLAGACIKKPELVLFDPNKPKFDGVSCPGNCFILAGQLRDTPYLNKLGDLELKFYYRRYHSSFSDFLGSCRTDASGVYQFRFDASAYLDPKAGYFFIEYSSDKFMSYSPKEKLLTPVSFHLDSSDLDKPYVQDFTLVQRASLRILIRSAKQVNFEDLKVRYSYGMGGYVSFFKGPGPFEKDWKVVTAAGIPTTIEWDDYHSIKGNGSINVQPGTEPVYEIEF
jgi:hypothetical protein